MGKRFVILDGSSLVYRAFFALPPLTAATGEPTNAIHGFANMLSKLMPKLRPDLLAVALDKSRRTFRTEMYAQYKGTREKTPPELSAQIPLLHEFVAAWGIALIELDGYEADDIIGTLATQAAAQGHEAIVVTGDRDALQLVRPGVKVMLTKKGITEMKEYDDAAFTEEYGLTPPQLIDLKGLMGDASDNIPGVPGIGPKTATKLLAEYHTVENVLSHIDAIAGKKLQERLAAGSEQALLSKKLATIELNVPGLAFAPDDYGLSPDRAKLSAFCQRYGLRGALKNFDSLFPGPLGAGKASANETAGSGEGELDLFAAPALAGDNFAYESLPGDTGNAPWQTAGQVAVRPCFKGQPPFLALGGLMVVPCPSEAAPGGGVLECFYVAAGTPLYGKLLAWLNGTSATLYTFGLKAWCQAGVTLAASAVDLELSAYLLQPGRTSYALAELWAGEVPAATVPDAWPDGLAKAAWEARAIARLGAKLNQRLAEAGMGELYAKMERPLACVLARMEQTGIYVNRGHLRERSRQIGQRLDGLERTIYDLAGGEFNINSPKQLGEVLFERLGLAHSKKTKTGYSTNAEVLESLRGQHDIIDNILAYRLWVKLKRAYTDAIAGLINPATGRVHTSFNQTVTATGRLSSSEPNLQNIPVRTEAGREIRALFEPGTGYDCLLSADYSQIELRLLAHMSGDAAMIDAFRQNQDIHARTAAEVFAVPLGEVTAQLRRKAKAVNFGIVYGISDYGLSRDLKIPRAEAASYIESYFAKYGAVKEFLDRLVAEARAHGYVTTLFGRRRALPAINSASYNQRSLAERMAMNTPIQGTAADIIKLAMIAASQKLQAAGLKSRLILQVHDELVLEATEAEIGKVTALLKEAMEHVCELSVPLAIDVNVGRNWAEAK